MIFSGRTKDEFKVKSVTTSEVNKMIETCGRIYRGAPDWVNDETNVKTINFAQTICEEVARLSVLGINIKIEGDSNRAADIQKKADAAKSNLRQWIEYAAAYGTIIIKPNGDSVECVLPDSFMIVDQKDGNATAAVFVEQKKVKDVTYTKFEYHRFIGDVYEITNRCYTGKSADKSVDIKNTPWRDLEEETAINNITDPLFSVLKMPGGNYLEENSSVALPLFSKVLEELKDLDTAYSRNALEIFDSEKIVVIDSDRLVESGSPINGRNYESKIKELRLPHYVRAVGGGNEELYKEIVPSLETEKRIAGINNYLSQIGFKVGFSNGYFVFDQKTGMITATQVTSDQARTIQLIDDVRAMVVKSILGMIKAINYFEDLYSDTGHIDINDTDSTDELDRTVHVHFTPIYTNKEEDRARALQLTNSGYYPKWYYLHMYEGLSEEEAKRLTQEAQPKETGLFVE